MDTQRSPRTPFTQSLKRAYFSILQFIPDPIRNERVNIAVLLESPEYAYRGAKYLRYMHSKLRTLDPNVDDPLVYAVARNIEQEFQNREKDFAEQPIPFQNQPHPEHLERLKVIFETSDRTLWQLSEPQLVLLPADQRFVDRLNALYRRFIERPEAPKAENYDKDYVRQTVVKGLEKRQVILDTAPKPLAGGMFEENAFDAAYIRNVSTYMQFLSYDLQDPDLDQLRLFLSSVEDIRRGGKFVEDHGFYYMTIVQPPTHFKNETNKTVFRKALAYLKRNGIPAFKPDGQQLEVVAEVLLHNQNPANYPNLLNS
jgi:hypothetical protein